MGHIYSKNTLLTITLQRFAGNTETVILNIMMTKCQECRIIKIYDDAGMLSRKSVINPYHIGVFHFSCIVLTPSPTAHLLAPLENISRPIFTIISTLCPRKKHVTTFSRITWTISNKYPTLIIKCLVQVTSSDLNSVLPTDWDERCFVVVGWLWYVLWANF